MIIDFPKTDIDLLLIRKFGDKVFVIGGPVRDKLRGIFHGGNFDPKDQDYVIVDHTLDEVRRRLEGLGRLDAVGASFGVLKYTMPGQPTVDIALPRRERSIGRGHKDFEIVSGPAISIEEDQARRDFRMNAVAVRLMTGELIAHPGALDDIRTKRISVINGRQSFLDDPLRMLRAAQFAARFEFEIEEMTTALMSECASMIIAEPRVSAERIAEELNKMLVRSARPSKGVRILRDTGLLKLVLPDLARTVEVKQNRFHDYDVFDHTLAVLDASRPTLLSRWAALLHDVGKPATQSREPGPNGFTFYGHETVGAETSRRLLTDLRFPYDFVEQVTRLVANHMYKADPSLPDRTIKRFINRIGLDLLDDQFHLRQCDRIGKGPSALVESPTDIDFERRVRKVLLEKPPLDIKDLVLNGDDVIKAMVSAGLKPKNFKGGPEVGRILRALRERVIDDPSLNSKEPLRAELLKLI